MPHFKATGRGHVSQRIALMPNHQVHLFDAPFVGLHESKFTSAGAELVTVANSPAGTLGLSVCYDLRFAALYSR
jgi:predicted amidohydrolase